MFSKIIGKDKIQIGAKEICLPCNIMKNPDGNPFVIEIDNLVIINFYGGDMSTIDNKEIERNIWAFNKEGVLVWKIQPPTARIYNQNPYTSVCMKDGKVLAGNWSGADYIVDISNGKIEMIKGLRPW